MRPIVLTVGALATADADGIALSQTPSAGALTLNGVLVIAGVAVLDKPRRVLLTTTADETSKTFVFTGTSDGNTVISESVAGVNATTAATLQDFKTVTSITISSNAAGALTVGTNGVASTAPAVLDIYARSTIALQCDATGTVNYTVQQTLDNPWTTEPESVLWVNHPASNLVAATGDVQGNYAYPPFQTRVVLNSGTGSVVFTVVQPGIIG